MTDFDRAMQHVIFWETKKTTNDPNDPGGLTKFGISKRAHPTVDVENLTLENALEIYRAEYWNACRCDSLVFPVSLCVVDMAITSGQVAAIRCLQRALKVDDDGVLGEKTLGALRDAEPFVAAYKTAAERVLFYSRLPHWDRYGKGWTRRAISAAMGGIP